MRDAVGDIDEAIAVDIDDPPASVPQPGIEPQNAHFALATAPAPDQAPSRAITSSATSKLA